MALRAHVLQALLCGKVCAGAIGVKSSNRYPPGARRNVSRPHSLAICTTSQHAADRQGQGFAEAVCDSYSPPVGGLARFETGVLHALRTCHTMMHFGLLTSLCEHADLGKLCYAAGATLEELRGCVRHLIVYGDFPMQSAALMTSLSVESHSSSQCTHLNFFGNPLVYLKRKRSCGCAGSQAMLPAWPQRITCMQPGYGHMHLGSLEEHALHLLALCWFPWQNSPAAGDLKARRDIVQLFYSCWTGTPQAK